MVKLHFKTKMRCITPSRGVFTMEWAGPQFQAHSSQRPTRISNFYITFLLKIFRLFYVHQKNDVVFYWTVQLTIFFVPRNEIFFIEWPIWNSQLQAHRSLNTPLILSRPRIWDHAETPSRPRPRPRVLFLVSIDRSWARKHPCQVELWPPDLLFTRATLC